MFRSRKFSLTPTPRPVLITALVLMTLALVGLPAAAQKATPTYLNSDIPNVGTVMNNDTNLVNPWGLVSSPTSPWWISDNGTGLSTLYDGSGNPKSLVVTILNWDGSLSGGSPDGIVFNSTSDFQLSAGNPATFMWATEDGTIQGWNHSVNPTMAVIEVNNFPNAVYKGLALASAGGANYLYAANFRGGTVDVFDKNFASHSFGSGAFMDATIPMGFAPFNVANIGNGMLAVTYAKQDAAKHDDVKGPGNGYIDLYDTSGNLLTRLQRLPFLNSPWGVVVAPASGFGGFSGDILVGQFGSGAIVAYTLGGQYVGLLLDPAILQLQIDGLWGLAFGNGSGSGPTTTLYFTAGVFGENHGIFGSITCCSGSVLGKKPTITLRK